MANQKRVRSPRFSVPNNEEAVVSMGADRLKGTLQVLSLTGGAIRLNKQVASGTFGDIRLNTVSGTVSAAVEFLRMANGRAQAFKFIAMSPVARERLQHALDQMRGQGLAVNKTPMDQLRNLAHRVLSFGSR